MKFRPLVKHPMEQLHNIPRDLISSVKVSSNGHILVTSWDGSINLYSKAQYLTTITDLDPVLCSVWDSGSRSYAANVQGEVYQLDFESGKRVPLSTHSLGVSALACVAPNVVVSGSWDASLGINDSRTGKLVRQLQLPGKVLSMDADSDHLVVAMSKRVVHIYDVRDFSSPLQVRESGLRYQTRDIKLMPDGSGYAQSSIEGRVAVEDISKDDVWQSQKYAFKCHRVVASPMDFVSPVNALCFSMGKLFTGGSDCKVSIWDYKLKRKIKTLPAFNDAIVAMDCNDSFLCIATSDDSFKTASSVEEISLVTGGSSAVYIRDH